MMNYATAQGLYAHQEDALLDEAMNTENIGGLHAGHIWALIREVGRQQVRVAEATQVLSDYRTAAREFFEQGLLSFNTAANQDGGDSSPSSISLEVA